MPEPPPLEPRPSLRPRGYRPDCPVPPPTPDPEHLGFEPFLPMVRWFAPAELVRSGVKAVLSALFGAYADNRELQAIRTEIAPFSYADRDELWIDYVADLGDGWNPTYAIARLLAASTLTLDDRGTPVETRRGDLLIMGGDQVYPTATRKDYNDRLVGPYRSALPCVLPSAEAPHLYALPGNHDWYDGLTSFTRLFCLNRWIGGWKTHQTRSYFALELPHGWWLWGIDVQLDSDVDLPQVDFFRSVAADMPAGSKIILCVAEPAWVYSGLRGLQAYESFAFFERETIHRYGHHHVVGIGSDLHAYARYESADGRQRFVSGGGGAYLYPTHQLPTHLLLPSQPHYEEEEAPQFEVFSLGGEGAAAVPVPAPKRKGPKRPESATMKAVSSKAASSRATRSEGAAAQAAVFPRRRRARQLARHSLLFPFYNPSFALFIGSFYLFLAWLLQSASKIRPPSLLQVLAAVSQDPSPHTVTAALKAVWQDLAHAPLAVLTVLALIFVLVGSTDARGKAKWTLGLAHAFGHVVATIVLTWGFASFNLNALGLAEDDVLQVLLFTLEIVGPGGFAGGFLLGLYLYLAHKLFPGVHTNEVLLCQRREDYKHVLRLHIDREGGLTIHPIGMAHAPRSWTYRPDAGPGEAWFEPSDGPITQRVALIEPPIRLSPKAPGGRWTPQR
ncbi:MAG TPA: hypothetical protein VK002_12670 [Rubricoccaceae bacterium]|nr:hypothetical protein [Rubricoccaceae bacterium]